MESFIRGLLEKSIAEVINLKESGERNRHALSTKGEHDYGDQNQFLPNNIGIMSEYALEDNDEDDGMKVTGIERELEEIAKSFGDTLDPESPLMNKFQAIIEEKLKSTLERLKFENEESRKALKEIQNETRQVGLVLNQKQEHYEKLKVKAREIMEEKQSVEENSKDLMQTKAKLENDLNLVNDGIKEEQKLIREAQKHRQKLELELTQIKSMKKAMEDEQKVTGGMLKKTSKDLLAMVKEKDSQDSKIEQLSWVLDTKILENKSIESECRNAELINRRLQEEYEELETKKVERDVMLKVSENRLTEVLKEIEAGNLASVKLEQEREKIMLESKSIQLEIKKINDERAKQSKIHKEIGEKKKSTNDEIERNHQEITQIRDDNLNAKNQIEKLEKLRLESQKILNEVILEMKYSSHNNLLKEKRNEVVDFEKDLGKKRKENNELDKNLLQISLSKCLNDKEAGTIQKEIEGIMTDIDNLEVKKYKLDNELARSNSKKLKLIEMKDNFDSESKRVEEECVESEKSLDLTVRNLKDCEKELRMGQQRIELLNKKIADAKEKNGGVDASPLELEVISLKKSIAQKRQEQREIEREWLKFRESLVLQQESKKKLQKQVESLKERYEILKKEESEANRILEEVKKRHEKIQEETERLQAFLQRLGVVYSREGASIEEVEKSTIQMEEAFKISLNESQTNIEQAELKISESRVRIDQLIRKNFEHEVSIGTWCEKLEILREIINSVNNKEVKDNIRQLNLKLHNLEVEENELRKQQEQILVSLEKIAHYKSENLFSFKKQDNDVERLKSLKAASKANLEFKVNEKKREIQKVLREHERIDILLKERKQVLSARLSRSKEVEEELQGLCDNLVALEIKHEKELLEKSSLQFEVSINQERQKESRRLLEEIARIDSYLTEENRHKLKSNVDKLKSSLEDICSGNDHKFNAVLANVKSQKIVKVVKEYVQRIPSTG